MGLEVQKFDFFQKKNVLKSHIESIKSMSSFLDFYVSLSKIEVKVISPSKGRTDDLLVARDEIMSSI